MKKLEDQEIFETLEPIIKKNIDELFVLLKDDLKLFKLILEKCKKVDQYDEAIDDIITADAIRIFIMNYIGNTKENASKIIGSAKPLHYITDCISSYISPISELSRDYIDIYSTELLKANSTNDTSINIIGQFTEIGDFE